MWELYIKYMKGNNIFNIWRGMIHSIYVGEWYINIWRGMIYPIYEGEWYINIWRGMIYSVFLIWSCNIKVFLQFLLNVNIFSSEFFIRTFTHSLARDFYLYIKVESFVQFRTSVLSIVLPELSFAWALEPVLSFFLLSFHFYVFLPSVAYLLLIGCHCFSCLFY